MFQPETEDMLPRMAPKPSPDVPSGASEGIIRPQVPEVSILFGQQDANVQQQVFNTASQHQQNKHFPMQTYASWKKQMLPKVVYPASLNIADTQLQENIAHGYNCAGTNMYPIRSNNNPTLNLATNRNTNAFGACNGSSGVVGQLTYRRSLESCNQAYQQIPILQPQPSLGTMQPALTHLPNITSLCAGTQTDAIVESANNYPQHIQLESLSNLASKKDVENVRQILDELKVEQQRMLKMLETILLAHDSQMSVKPQCSEVGVQVDGAQTDNLPYVNGNIGSFQDEPLPKNKFLQHLKPTVNISQTPKGKPMAQSTTYRTNTPQHLKKDIELASNPTYQQTLCKPISKMPKSASDTSLAMNELALKYLPNEKLSELLKELNMNCPLDAAATNVPKTPNRVNRDKVEKGSSDISNASYKYLKKYRLLPEDHEENINIVNNTNEWVMENGNDNQPPQYNVRNTPINQRTTPTNQCLPYAGRLPLSPLAIASSPLLQSTVPQHIVNLENIKHQPKFL